jgi:hypothetical protein
MVQQHVPETTRFRAFSRMGSNQPAGCGGR